MNGEVVRVDPDALRAQANVVGRVAYDVAVARSAGVQVVLGREAFGQLCRFLPEMLEQTTTAAVDALAAAAEAGRETAIRLRQVVGRYEQADDASQALLGRIWPGRQQPW